MTCAVLQFWKKKDFSIGDIEDEKRKGYGVLGTQTIEIMETCPLNLMLQGRNKGVWCEHHLWFYAII